MDFVVKEGDLDEYVANVGLASMGIGEKLNKEGRLKCNHPMKCRWWNIP